MSFTIAIAGRPNVGKSTLFNRLVGKSMALVSDEAGVTRDWREGEGRLHDLTFDILDTAGLEEMRPKGSLSARTAARTKEALDRTDVILFLVDARVGLTQEDKSIARDIRKTGKPIILVANKCEGTYLPASLDEMTALGFGEPVPVSAAHAEGMGELYEALQPHVPEGVERSMRKRKKWSDPARSDKKRSASKDKKPAETGDEEFPAEDDKHLNIAIVGRPNAGKSTLINQLIGEDRMMTGPEPGLTRDSIPIAWEYKNRPVRLVDTAGLRRKARITGHLEKLSTHESLRAIRLANVVILVVDAMIPLEKQDLTIAHHVVEEGRALIIAANKWDTVKDKRGVLKTLHEITEDSLAQVAGIPVVTLSALKGDGADMLMKAVLKVYDTWNIRISTGKLNRWLEEMETEHPPPITSGRRIKLRYMTQVKSRPPTFSLWVNNVDLPESYKRFLTNGLRKVFGIEGVPIRWQMKKSANPYEDKKKTEYMNKQKHKQKNR